MSWMTDYRAALREAGLGREDNRLAAERFFSMADTLRAANPGVPLFEVVYCAMKHYYLQKALDRIV